MATDVFIKSTFTHPTRYIQKFLFLFLSSNLLHLVSLNVAFKAQYGLHSVLHVFTRSLFFFCFFLTNSVMQSRIICYNRPFPSCLSVSKWVLECVKLSTWKWVWFARKLKCRWKTFSYEWFCSDLFWYSGKQLSEVALLQRTKWWTYSTESLNNIIWQTKHLQGGNVRLH